MKRLLFSLLLCASSVFAQTNTNVINIYSTPKLGTIFNSSQFLVTTNVANSFTNISVSLQPALAISTNVASSTNAGIITEYNYTDFSLKPFQTLEPPLMFVETWILVPDLNTNISETSILTLATNMVNYGYVTNGWNGILIDEPWLSGHDTNGFPVASTNRFPNGMSNLVFKLRSMGITNVGLFASLGTSGVSPDPDKSGNPLVIGHAGYIESDAAYMTTNWGVNFFYLVVDDNGYGSGVNYQKYRQFINAARATGKNPRFLGTTHQFESWLIDGLESRLWVYDENTYRDSDTSWAGIMRWVDAFPQQAGLVKCGNTLMYGWLGATLDTSYSYPSNRLAAYKTQMGMAAMWHMPMGIGNVYDTSIAGVDLKSVLWNRKMQEIQKSTLGAPPKMLYSNNSVQIWSEPFGDFSSYNRYVALLNRDTNSSKTITFTLDKIQVPNGYYVYTNIWSGAGGVVSGNSMTVTVAPYMTEIFEIRGPGGANADNLVLKTNPVFKISETTDPEVLMTFTNYGRLVNDTSLLARPALFIGSANTNFSILQMGTIDPTENAFQILWNPIHENTNGFGGEMQITAPQFAIGPGWNGNYPVQIGTNLIGAYRPNRRIQVGIGEYRRGWVDIHFDSPGNKAIDPLGDTLPLRWQVQYYSNSVIEKFPTIQGKAYSTNGDYGLTLWKDFDIYLDNAIVQTNYTLYNSNRYIDFFMGRTNLAKFYYDIDTRKVTATNLAFNAFTNLLGTVYSDSTGRVTAATFNGKILPLTFTVATLPTNNITTGTQVYCSDTLTPYGTGGTVVWDGTNWRTIEHRIIATTLTNQFALNCWESGASFATKRAVSSVGGGLIPAGITTVGSSSVSVFDDGLEVSLAAATLGYITIPKHHVYTANLGVNGIGVSTWTSVLTSNTWFDLGFQNGATTNAGSARAQWICDPSGLLTNLATLTSLTGSAYNPSNICIMYAKPGDSTNLIDVGLAQATSPANPRRLYVEIESNLITWYTNGSIAFSTNSSLGVNVWGVIRFGKLGSSVASPQYELYRDMSFKWKATGLTIP